MTEKNTKMSPSRFEYVKRLWSADLFLTFDGDLLHFADGSTFDWKTGAEIVGADRPAEKINDLAAGPLRRVRHSLTHIAEAWAEENRASEPKILEKASK